MNSHALAKHLQSIAKFLESRANFETDSIQSTHYSEKSGLQTNIHFYNKEKFTEAAKLFGNATKEFENGEYADFKLTSTTAPISLRIPRDKVCRKTVKFECEPLFSTEELNNLGG
jgi:hypothetical protein